MTHSMEAEAAKVSNRRDRESVEGNVGGRREGILSAIFVVTVAVLVASPPAAAVTTSVQRHADTAFERDWKPAAHSNLGPKSMPVSVGTAEAGKDGAPKHKRKEKGQGSPQFEAWLNKIIEEKGVDQYEHAADDIDVSQYHFPKKGPAIQYQFKEKTHKSRYRNYKTRPEHPMIHTLKVPSKPTTVFAFASVDEGKTDVSAVDVYWTPPESDGGTPITSYEISRDGGIIWTDLGTVGNSTRVEGVEPNERFSVSLRAVNQVGSGEWTTSRMENVLPLRYRARLEKEAVEKQVVASAAAKE